MKRCRAIRDLSPLPGLIVRDGKLIADGAMLQLDWLWVDERFCEQLWAACKARKPSVCVLSGKAIAPGDKVFRPVGNSSNRMRRILVAEAVAVFSGQRPR